MTQDHSESRDYSSYTPNDGSCTTIDNTQAVASGRTGVSNDTQWLYSQVKQVRGEIKPGITKKLTAAVKTDGTVVKDPLAAHPTDTLRWNVTAANDGHYPIYDYVLSDTMQEPYQFAGKVSYTIYGADQTVYKNDNLFSISAPDANGNAELTCYKGPSTDKFSLSVNGKPVECAEWPYGFKYQVRLTKDAQTGRYTLSIRFPDSACAIPAGGTGVLTLETKRTDNRLVNTVYTNRDNLLRDEYRYKEIQAPAGYALDNTVRTIKQTDAAHTVTIVNTKNHIFPLKAGGSGTGRFAMGGILLLTICLLGYGLMRRRERR
ncbi:MAG: hypothetical protein ACI33O_05320 [Bhargavaea sp.]